MKKYTYFVAFIASMEGEHESHYNLTTLTSDDSDMDYETMETFIKTQMMQELEEFKTELEGLYLEIFNVIRLTHNSTDTLDLLPI